MRFSSRLAVGITAAAALAVASAPGAAFAAPAKKTPVLTVKVAPGSIVVGHQATITPSLHLPAKDKLKSYTVTFADGSKATGSSKGVKLPKSWKHIYTKALSGKVTVTVKDTLKHTYSATAAIKVTNPPVVTPPLPPVVITPAPPAYVAPAGIFSGHVSSLGVPLAGITVSVTDDFTGGLYGVTQTDSHGNWAFASLPQTPTYYGYYFGDDININSVNGYDNASPAYNIVSDYGVNPAVPTAYNIDLPPVASVTGTIVDPNGPIPADTAVEGCIASSDGGCTWWQVGTIDSTGHYSIPLGTGQTWLIKAISMNSDIESDTSVTVTVPAGSSAVTGPTLTLDTTIPAEQVVAHTSRAKIGAFKH